MKGRKRGEWRRGDGAHLDWYSQSKWANGGKRKGRRRRREWRIDPRPSAQECEERRDLATLWYKVMMLKARHAAAKSIKITLSGSA